MPKPTFMNLPEDKRLRIEDCALSEFAEYGYERSSVNRMVAAAGIAKGSFYQYFADKFDLYEHMITVAIAAPKLAVAEAAKRDEVLAGTPFFDLLRALFRRNAEMISRDKRVLKIAADLASGHGTEFFRRIVEPYASELHGFFLPFIEARKRAGEIRPGVDSEVLNALLLGIAFYVLNKAEEVGSPLVFDDYPDRVADALEAILARGIFTGGHEPSGEGANR